MGFLPMTGKLFRGGPACLLAANMALKHVNERDDILEGFHLILEWRDSKVRNNNDTTTKCNNNNMGRAKRIWYLPPMRAAKFQASLRIRAVSPEPPLLAHTSSESRGTFRQKTKSLAPLNGWACAVKICHDGMLEDTNSLDAAQKKRAS